MPPEPQVEVALLGPLEVRLGGARIRVDRPLERALLARLALAGGASVPDHRLAADLWGDVDLARPTERLRVLASRLRAAIGAPDALTRVNGGYALAVELTDLSAARAAAEQLHLAVRAGDPRAVRAAAQDALGHWRGPALADLRTVPYAITEGEQLDAWRLDLQVELLDAELALGNSAEAGRELEALAAENPVHERLWCLLALALYRTGRQADALSRLARLRSRLAEELGVDPAPDTATMELRLLRQDPALLLSPEEQDRPPLPVRPAVPAGDLPAPLTSFVGRRQELASLVERLAHPGLVTLIGGPGTGKSRLSFEAARALATQPTPNRPRTGPATPSGPGAGRPGSGLVGVGRGVRLVELGALGRVSAVLEAIAGDDAGGNDPVGAAAVKLDGSVLVLDNAEHLIEPLADLVARLLRLAPGLTILVSSQRPLQLEAEELRPIGPLDAIAAAQLFTERCAADAQGADPELVATICSAVDRLPLGIELAAGLTRTLTVRQLAQRLTDRMRLLVAGGRDALPGRHSSLVAALDWSHQLLGDPERAVLRRVAIFAGGFTLEAAEQVAADPRDVAPALTELADRSLLTVEAVNGRRFRLLETVRDYALRRLAEAGETETARAAELTWALGFVQAQAGDNNFASAESVQAVFAEWPNLLDCLDQAVGTPHEVEGLRLALALHTPWLIRGWYGEASRHFAALSEAPGATTAERLAAYSSHGFVLTMQGRLDQAAALLTEAEQLAAQQDDDSLTLTVLYYRGIVEIERGRLREAFAPLLAGQSLARTSSRHERRLSAFTDALGTLHVYTGRPEQAIEAYESCLVADREYGDEHGLCRGLSNLAGALTATGRHDEAIQAVTESDHYARRLDDRQILPLNEVVRAAVALARGAVGDAEKHLRTAVDYAIADGTGASLAHIDLADVLIQQGELDEAAGLLDQVFAEATPASTSWLAARTIAVALSQARGDTTEARTALADLTSAYHSSGFAWPRYQHRLDQLRAQLVHH